MTGEVLKWRSFAILFAHKQQRDERRKQRDSGCEFQCFEIYQAAESLSSSAIANLIVILIAYNNLRSGYAPG